MEKRLSYRSTSSYYTVGNVSVSGWGGAVEAAYFVLLATFRYRLCKCLIIRDSVRAYLLVCESLPFGR